ncbi:MAG: DUF4388 domain-containing protein [Pseudomonadota bacterium]
MSEGSISFGAILKKMHLEARMGQLHIESPDGRVVLHLRDGKIVNVETPSGEAWAIGEYLVGTSSISDRKMLKCVRIGQGSGAAPEMIAVERGYITQDVAFRFVELHAKETILPLFTKVGIMVRFQNQPPKANPLLPPISVPFLIKEGSKRAAEWPALVKRIPTFDMLYDKDPSFLNTLRRADGDSMDPFKVADGDRAMGANERIVYFFVDGKRNIRQLTRVAGLDLYSTCKALYNLESRFMVKATGDRASDNVTGGTVFPLLIRLATFVGLAAALTAVGFYLPGPLQFLSGKGSLDLERVEAVQRVRLEHRIRDTLEDVWLMTLQLPNDLGALPGITRRDLDAAGPLYYVPLPDGRYLLGRGQPPPVPAAAPAVDEPAKDDLEAARSEDAEPTRAD